jgi:hypothetical protein
MAFDGDCVHWEEDGICDWCYRKDFNRRAREKAPGLFTEESNYCAWVGGKATQEMHRKWKDALLKTEWEMTTKCAVFWTTDGDNGKLCENCLRSALEAKNG